MEEKGEGGYLGPQIDDRANNKLVWEDGVSPINLAANFMTIGGATFRSF